MAISPLAGKLAPATLLVDVGGLLKQYDERKPDPEDPQQRVLQRHRNAPPEREHSARASSIETLVVRVEVTSAIKPRR